MQNTSLPPNGNVVPRLPNHNQRKRPHKLLNSQAILPQMKSPMSPSDLQSSCISSSSHMMSSMSSNSPSSSSNSQSSSSSSSTSGQPKKKTKAHNNMERLRRVDLRNSFDNLKKLVPPLSKAPKCSKVEILRRAEEYITALRSLEKRLLKEEGGVRSKNEQLRARLAQLNQQQ